MSETANFGLPLVESGQAQKHVTVNEALARIDALGQLVVQSDTVTMPPAGAPDGQVWQVPAGAANEWSAQVGMLAVAANGGWEFVTPQVGWETWHAGEGFRAVFDGTSWRRLAAAEGLSGAATSVAIVEFDHPVVAGAGHSTIGKIPAMSILLGVTCRVTAAIPGSLASWKIGVASAEDRYGAGYGVALNTWGRGVTGTPVTYYADTPLLLTPTGGNFGGGMVRFALHTLALSVPDQV